MGKEAFLEEVGWAVTCLQPRKREAGLRQVRREGRDGVVRIVGITGKALTSLTSVSSIVQW